MQKEFNNIKMIIDRLQELQLSHISSFNKKGQLPDIEKQSFDREKAFNNLRKKITVFNTMAQVEHAAQTQPQIESQTESMLILIKDKITTLIEQNTTLETKIKEYRNNIKTSMKKISNGRQVIASYRSSTKITNNPKVINVTN